MYVGRIDKPFKYMELECRFLSLVYIELTCSVVSVYQSVCSKEVSHYPWSVTGQMEPTPSPTFDPAPLPTWGFLWPWPHPIRHVQTCSTWSSPYRYLSVTSWKTGDWHSIEMLSCLLFHYLIHSIQYYNMDFKFYIKDESNQIKS